MAVMVDSRDGTGAGGNFGGRAEYRGLAGAREGMTPDQKRLFLERFKAAADAYVAEHKRKSIPMIATLQMVEQIIEGMPGPEEPTMTVSEAQKAYITAIRRCEELRIKANEAEANSQEARKAFEQADSEGGLARFALLDAIREANGLPTLGTRASRPAPAGVT